MPDLVDGEIRLPECLAPLFEPYRYKILYGGRGGGKSYSVALILLIMGTMDIERILCAREIQTSIKDSVHRLLADQIGRYPQLKDFYTVTEKTIKGANGTEFLFTGLRTQDVHKIKSFEGVTRVWCEEAHVISKKSWTILIPTIRAKNSEIWATFNPDLDTDETYTRFVKNTPPDTFLLKMTYRDNIDFPEVLEKERLHMLDTDPDEHDHVWEGNPKSVVAGAIYAGEVTAMIQEGRIRPVPYDPELRVHTIWDLGWNDQTSIGFVQRLMSEVRIIRYLEDSFVTLDKWVKQIEKLPYRYGTHWIPHDGGHKDLKTGKSTQELMKKMGMRRVYITPKLPLEEGIRAARIVLPRTYIDEVQGERLVECLRRYRRSVPETTGEPGAPVHDEYSHGADMYRYLSTNVDKLTNDEPKPIKVRARQILDASVGY